MQTIQGLSEPFEGLSLLNCLEEVEDPRIDRTKLYPLREVLLVGLCAMLSGCEGFRAFAIYGEEKLNFLRRVYPFENGIPSHDTFMRIFTLLCPKSFSLLLTRWVEGLRKDVGSINHIAIDVKSLRGSRKTSSKYSAAHVVSAFASEARLTLAQAKAPSKGGGESEALLEIISYLKLNKAVITADAGVCHRKVAQGIIDKKADYILALKGNQGNAYEAVETYFNNSSLLKQCAYAEAFDKGHGRIETRKGWVTSDLRALEELPQWSKI